MKIPISVLSIVKCAALDGARYAFNGVLIERESAGMAKAVVTDGRRLLKATFPADIADDAKPCVVDGELFRKAAEVQTCAEHFEVDTASGMVSVGGKGGRIEFSSPPLESLFPTYRGVIPKYIPVERPKAKNRAATIHVNARLLGEMLLAAADIVAPGGRKACVALEVPLEAGKPIKITGGVPHSEFKVVGVLMPANERGTGL